MLHVLPEHVGEGGCDYGGHLRVGFCLVQKPKFAAKQTRKDAESEDFLRKFIGG